MNSLLNDLSDVSQEPLELNSSQVNAIGKGVDQLTNASKKKGGARIKTNKRSDVPVTDLLQSFGPYSFQQGRFVPAKQNYFNQAIKQANAGGKLGFTEMQKAYVKDLKSGLNQDSLLSTSLLRVFKDTTQKSNARTNMRSYLSKFRQERNKLDSPWFKELQNTLPGVWTWDQTGKMWTTQSKGLQKAINNPIVNKQMRKQTAFSKKMLSDGPNPEQVIKFVPPLVRQIIKSNKVFSSFPIGQVSQYSLPFYAGRYLDVVTGRIKTFPQILTKYLNPISLQQKIQYLQSKIISKWNGFVRASEQYQKNIVLDQAQYKQQRMGRIIAKAAPAPQYKRAWGNLARQMIQWKSGLDGGQSTKLVCNNLSQAQFKALYDILSPYLKSSTGALSPAVIKKTRQNINKILNQAYAVIKPPQKSSTPQQIRQYSKVTAAFSLWADKGASQTARAVKSLLRTYIPTSLSVAQAQKTRLKIDQIDAYLDKQAVGFEMDQATGLPKGFQNPTTMNKVDYAKFQQIAKKAEALSGTGRTIPLYSKTKNIKKPTIPQKVARFK